MGHVCWRSRLVFVAVGLASGYLVVGGPDPAAPAPDERPPKTDIRVIGRAQAVGLAVTTSTAWAPGGRRMATGLRDGTVCVWEPDGTPVGRWAALDVSVDATCFVGERSALLTAGDGVVRLWDLRGTVPVLTAEALIPEKVSSAAASPDGRAVALGHVGGTSLWGVEPGRLTPVGRLRAPPYTTDSLAFSPDGRTVAIGDGGDGSVRLWRPDDAGGEPERVECSDEYRVRALRFSADGGSLLALDTDGNVVCCNLANRTRATARLGLPTLRCGSFAPAGLRVLAAHHDGRVRTATVREPVPAFQGIAGAPE